MSFSSVALTLGIILAGPGQDHAGYVTTTVRGPDGRVQKVTRPYLPREGDLVFYDDHNVTWTLLFAWAGTGPPLHMGIIVKRPDGSLAVLEAGPDDKLNVYILDVPDRLKNFKGTITIRRCRTSLSREKSLAMTQFAQAQDGKRYAVIRLLLQGTAWRSRGPVREMFLANTYLDRVSWICSELAVAAGTVAGLFDPRVVRANVVYPQDLVDNHRFDLGNHWFDPELWRAELP